jgi:pyruvate/2-oxoglutarate dehydrogenase complex dihydrolipoamide dehydrogenase (E3) component
MGQYDAIIVGTGQAGPSLAGRLVTAGMTVAIIERKFSSGAATSAWNLPKSFGALGAR